MKERKDDHVKHRKTLMKRDNMTCQICGKKIVDYYDMSIDHIVARILGGTNDISNLQLAHKRCNIVKGAKESRIYRHAMKKVKSV